MICPAMLLKGMNAHAIWSITIAITAISFRMSEVKPFFLCEGMAIRRIGPSRLFDISIALFYPIVKIIINAAIAAGIKEMILIFF